MNSSTVAPFSTYQRMVLLDLGGLLFTVVLDFMLLPALSSSLLTSLSLTTSQFGWVASAYAFSAGVSALLSSGFADRFDRKKYLLFFYIGFLFGIAICGFSTSYVILFLGRVVTGIFGGVVASISYAIITDLFQTDQRGRAMGLLQVAFATSLVGGLPLALYLSSQFNWQWSYGFVFLIGLGFILWFAFYLKPLKLHLNQSVKKSSWQHLHGTLLNNRHALVYLNNTSIVFADVLFMTFFAAYCTYNLGISADKLPILYGIGGLTSLLSGPLLGQLADRIGQTQVFLGGTILAIIIVSIYTHLTDTALWLLIIIHSLLFVGITARLVTSSALATLVPATDTRGAFMSIDASIQQFTAGLAAVVAGWIVYEAADGQLKNFHQIGWIAIAFMVVSATLMNRIHKMIQTAYHNF